VCECIRTVIKTNHVLVHLQRVALCEIFFCFFLNISQPDKPMTSLSVGDNMEGNPTIHHCRSCAFVVSFPLFSTLFQLFQPLLFP
jgi:hypothetical protein